MLTCDVTDFAEKMIYAMIKPDLFDTSVLPARNQWSPCDLIF